MFIYTANSEANVILHFITTPLIHKLFFNITLYYFILITVTPRLSRAEPQTINRLCLVPENTFAVIIRFGCC